MTVPGNDDGDGDGGGGGGGGGGGRGGGGGGGGEAESFLVQVGGAAEEDDDKKQGDDGVGGDVGEGGGGGGDGGDGDGGDGGDGPQNDFDYFSRMDPNLARAASRKTRPLRLKKKLYEFYAAPITKYYCHSVAYAVFLFLYTYICLVR